MTEVLWQRVSDMLYQALQLIPRERARFLDENCGSDAALRAEIESLLALDADGRSHFLDSPAIDLTTSLGLAAGQMLAERFVLIRKLGEGGMGQVWLAEQTAPVHREVALKLIKAGMYDDTVLQRFQSERQSLAIMDHPAIAKIFEAGATAQGQPYFVMEYVAGQPITEYCDQHRLGIRDRLELFVQTCEAVQHAHQKAIIHRDLKPANILVLEVDGQPRPRIIDFGLAKAISPATAPLSRCTRIGFFLGTPGYMSPEQFDAGGSDIDTRTDVYSLGVILYVLLTGAQPFERDQQPKPSLLEFMKRQRDEEAPSPSERIRKLSPASSGIAQARDAEPRKLRNLLRGDLDSVTMKALERNRDLRYGSPFELGADIRRYMNYEPVMARAASAGHRLRKYIRRHRGALSAATALVLTVAAFAVFQTLQVAQTSRERDRANTERDRANAERDRATRVTDFMTGMFKVSDPSEARGNKVTAREILDKASNDIQTGLARDPSIQAQMMQVMANTYLNLGLLGRAQEMESRALAARQTLFGPYDAKTLESKTQLGNILDRGGQYRPAEELVRQALIDAQRVLGPEHPQTLDTMDRLAYVLQDEGRNEEAELLEREVIETATRRLGAESALTLQSINHLASVLLHEGRYASAEQIYRRALDLDRRVLGPDHPQTLSVTGNLAISVHKQNRMDEAELLYREALAANQRVLGPDHQNTAVTMDNLATLLTTMGKLVEAEQLSRRALDIRLRTLGTDHPHTLVSMHNLTDVLLREGHVQESEKLQREVLDKEAHLLGPQHPETWLSQATLAGILVREGHYAEAEAIARQTLDSQTSGLGAQHPDTLETLKQLGKAMAYTHRYAEAASLFRDVIEQSDHSSAEGHRWSPWYGLACVATAAARFNDALRYLQTAVDRGYTGADALLADVDLKSLHSNPRFQRLVADLRRPPLRSQDPPPSEPTR